MKLFLDAATRQKVVLYGDVAPFALVLPAVRLPEELGGTDASGASFTIEPWLPRP